MDKIMKDSVGWEFMGFLAAHPSTELRRVAAGLGVCLCLLLGCADRVGVNGEEESNDSDWELEEEPYFDIEECWFINQYGEEDDSPGILTVKGPGDLEGFEGMEGFCFNGLIKIEDDNEALHNLEQLSGVEYIFRLYFGRDLSNVCGPFMEPDGGCLEEPPASINSSLESLRGLESLQRIGVLQIFAGGGFDTLDGLQGLKQIDSLLTIGAMDFYDVPYASPRTLEGLDNLRVIGGDLQIGSWSELESLDGLEGLREIGGEVFIAGPSTLEDISALENLESIGGDLIVWPSSGLHTCAGIRLLESIGRENIGGEVSIPAGDERC